MAIIAKIWGVKIKNFIDSIKNGFIHYTKFRGVTGRQDFWFFIIFLILGNLITIMFDLALGHQGTPEITNTGTGFNISYEYSSGFIQTTFILVTFVPSLAIQSRRLHDRNVSAWAILLWMIPIVGWCVLLNWFVRPSLHENNKYLESNA